MQQFVAHSKLGYYPCFMNSVVSTINKSASLYVDNNYKYYIIGEVNLLKYKLYDYKSIKWMYNRIDKLDKDVFDKENKHLMIKKNFEIQTYFNPEIPKNKRYLLIKLLDPLNIWYQKKLSLIKRGLNIADILSLRPTSWITSSMLEAFIKYISQTKASVNNILFMYPSLYTLFAASKDTRNKILEKIMVKDYVYIACLVQTKHNHWIIIEYDLKNINNNFHELIFADSLVSENNSDTDTNTEDDGDSDSPNLTFKEITEHDFGLVMYTILIDNLFLNDIKNEADYKDKKKKISESFDTHFCFKETDYCEKQNNSYDCGAYCALRLFLMKYDKKQNKMTYINNVSKITSMTIFRLYILSFLIDIKNCHQVLQTNTLNNESDDDYSDIEMKMNMVDDETTVEIEDDELNQQSKYGNDEVTSQVTDASDMKYNNSVISDTPIINGPSTIKDSNKLRDDNETKSENSSVAESKSSASEKDNKLLDEKELEFESSDEDDEDDSNLQDENETKSVFSSAAKLKSTGESTDEDDNNLQDENVTKSVYSSAAKLKSTGEEDLKSVRSSNSLRIKFKKPIITKKFQRPNTTPSKASWKKIVNERKKLTSRNKRRLEQKLKSYDHPTKKQNVQKPVAKNKYAPTKTPKRKHSYSVMSKQEKHLDTEKRKASNESRTRKMYTRNRLVCYHFLFLLLWRCWLRRPPPPCRDPRGAPGDTPIDRAAFDTGTAAAVAVAVAVDGPLV